MEPSDKPVRVSFTVTLRIDPEAWEHEYGITREASYKLADALRRDVRKHATQSLYALYTDLGVLAP